MNAKRRNSLKEALTLLDRVESIVDAVCDEEQDCMDNTPENFQCTDRYESMETAVENLNEALETIGSVRVSIEDTIQL
jgi:hypothetical protein